MRCNSGNLDVVVGVDDELSTWEAVRWAANEAAMRNGTLTVVYVADETQTLPPDMPRATHPSRSEERRQALAREAAKILAEAHRIAGHIAGDRPLVVRTETMFGQPMTALVDLSKQARLVVVGSGRKGALAQLPLGTISTGVVHHAHCPVAVIRDDGLSRDAIQRPVLVGIDGSRSSELATQIAFDEASQRGVDLIALHAWSESEVSDVSSLESSALERRASEILAERLAGRQEQYPDVIVHRSVVWGDPACQLLEASQLVQLVVVGSHGRGAIGRALLGSVSGAVVRKACVPVIVARSR